MLICIIMKHILIKFTLMVLFKDIRQCVLFVWERVNINACTDQKRELILVEPRLYVGNIII